MGESTQGRWTTSGVAREDLDFIRESEAALREAPPRLSLTFLLVCLGFFLTFLIWAYLAQLEEVARGDGRVIPSSKMQIIQSLEGGIVENIEVREGETVEKGQLLLRIDDTGFSSDLGELKAKEMALMAQVKRLRTEASDDLDARLEFPPKLIERAPDVVDNERILFGMRRNNLRNQMSVLEERAKQKRLDLAELKENKKRYATNLDLAQQEKKLKAPLVERGIVPKTEFLELQREISDLAGQLATTKQSIPRAEAAIREAEQLIEEQRLKFIQEAQSELNTKLSEFSVVRESMKAATDRVQRTGIRSPVAGKINKLHVNTLGGVVQAGKPMVEITPIGDNLLVEVRIKPSDIAFIRSGQPALVKLTAYDFTIYGGLEGEVIVISPDSTVDEKTDEVYYAVTIRTNESVLRKGNEILPIIPGMVATVDIITGEKSVLDYILKPIIKVREEALRER